MQITIKYVIILGIFNFVTEGGWNSVKTYNTNTDVVIFDVENTIYDRNKLKKHMMLQFIKHYMLNIWKFKEAIAVIDFIKTRNTYKNATTEYICEEISKKLHLDGDRTYRTIMYWTEKAHLPYMKRFVRNNVLSFMSYLQEHGCKIVIYSNTHIADELKALCIATCDKIYMPADGEVWRKNDKAKEIYKELALDKAKTTYVVGDMIDEDGEFAYRLKATFLHVFDSETPITTYQELYRAQPVCQHASHFQNCINRI